MGDLIFVGLTVGFFLLSAWLVSFADRIMPTPPAEREEVGREEER